VNFDPAANREDSCTYISVGKRSTKCDNPRNMLAAHQNTFSDVRSTLVEILSQCRTQRSTPSYPLQLILLWRTSRRFEKVERKLEGAWATLQQSARSRSGFYRVEAEYRENLDVGCIEKAAIEVSACLDAVSGRFPRLVARTKLTLAKIEQLARNIRCVFPVDDKDRLRQSERNYQDGELLDFESFLNEVQRVG
jgi:hypothetical protein